MRGESLGHPNLPYMAISGCIYIHDDGDDDVEDGYKYDHGYLHHDHNHAGDVDVFDDDATDDLADNHDGNDDISGDFDGMQSRSWIFSLLCPCIVTTTNIKES